MSRLLFSFACGGTSLAGTLDTAPGTSGLLIVSGGNEIRSGGFSGQAALAAQIARAGFPVFRFDRRGIGDSDGENRGFRHSQADIASALSSFRAMAPQLTRVVGFGNCDGASALALNAGAGCDKLVLSNPWVIEDEEEGALPPPTAIRSRYAEKLRNPRELGRLLTGGVNLRKLAGGLKGAFSARSNNSDLSQEIRSGIERFGGPVTILLAGRDRTAQVFEDNWDTEDERIQRCEKATHSYVEPEAREWLERQILAALRR